MVVIPRGHKTNEDLLAQIFSGLMAMFTTTIAMTLTSASASSLAFLTCPPPSALLQAQQALIERSGFSPVDW
jgi:hypothetical protein